MQLTTLQFGELDIEEKDIFTFPQGIPGFEDYRQYVFIQPDEKIPFSHMQSVEEGNLSFVITDPFLFYPDYQFDLPENILEELRVQTVQEVSVWSIVSIPGDLRDATLNLLAPVIVNMNSRQGKQIILHDTMYKTKHKLIVTKHSESIRLKGGARC